MTNNSLSIRHKALLGFGVILVGGIAIGAVYQWRLKAEEVDRHCCDRYALRTSTSAAIRAQQVFFIEKKRFASSVEELGMTLSPERQKVYNYSAETHPNRTIIRAITKDEKHRSYIGAAFAFPNSKLDAELTKGIVCVAKEPGIQPIAPPINAQTCGEGTIDILKD
jgi:Type IV pilin-like G and H, putative